MNQAKLLSQMLEEMQEIKAILREQNNPVNHVRIEERAEAYAEAMKSDDAELLKQLRGRFE